MLNYIHEFPNEMAKEFNDDFLNSRNDVTISELVVMVMKELEAIENIEILSYDLIDEQDKVDINEHMININFKKKGNTLDIPKYKYISNNQYEEMIFKIRVHTNLEEKIITKKILIPVEIDGFYLINDKKWKTLWQLVDASTYSQRGKITLKSRMPIIIYQSKRRPVMDIDGNMYEYQSYSYALNTRYRRRAAKVRVRFINPLMIFGAKIGIPEAIRFFGFEDLIELVSKVKNDQDVYRYYPLDKIYIKVDKALVDKHKIVQSFVCMLYQLSNRDFPLSWKDLNDKEYWLCRIGYVGSVKSKNIYTYYEKGKTTLYMIERLLDSITVNNLRLPEIYKKNIYFVLKWMILNFDELKNRNNMDLANKRIRKNEYIVLSSLGKKVSENINKIIEKLSKSKMNTMATLLEVFNFSSNIILNAMRNISDLVKSDELVNDMTFLQDLAFSTKGPNAMGENSSKMIAVKYRNIHPSYVGKIDLNVSSNSDPGMSGSFTPFLQLYDNFYFTPEHEPCEAEYHIEQMKRKFFFSEENKQGTQYIPIDFKDREEFIKYQTLLSQYKPEELNYEKIEIVEKEVTEEDGTESDEHIKETSESGNSTEDSDSD